MKATHPTTILVVDDDPFIRETLETLLAHAQNRIVCASSGEEGLRKAHELKPDLILLDVMMPVLNGFEVCRRLRADAALAEIPVLMVTALDDRNSRLKGIEAGADDFIQKPFDSVELRARVGTITSLGRYRKLMAERERSQWLVDHSQDAVLVLDSLLCVRYLNHAAKTLLQLRPGAESETDIHLMEVLPRHFRCEPRKAWASWLEHPSTSPSPPLLLVRPATETSPDAWHEMSVWGEETGSGGEIVLQIRDVSPLIQARLLQWSFERAVAHKLATPLTGLMGILDILRSALLPQIRDPEVIEYVGLLSQSADRLHGAVKDVLQYVATTSLSPTPEGFHLALLANVLGTAATEAGVTDIKADLPHSLLDLRVALSKRMVEIILTQLLENAVKFHPRRQPKIKLSATTDTLLQRITLRLQDDGVTLSSEQLGQAWEPYYQAEKLATGQVPGMGLGLSRVAMLMAQIGGTCWMENVPDAPGVVVFLELPILPHTARPAPGDPSPHPYPSVQGGIRG